MLKCCIFESLMGVYSLAPSRWAPIESHIHWNTHINLYIHDLNTPPQPLCLANPITYRNAAESIPLNPRHSQILCRLDNVFCLACCSYKAHCLHAVACWSGLSSPVRHPPSHSHRLVGIPSVHCKKPQFLIHTRTDANSHTHWIVAGCLRLLLKWLANHQELHRLLELYQSIVHHPWSSLPWWFGYSLRLYVWESVCFCVCLCVCDSGGIAWTGIKDRDVHSKAESDGNH